VRKHAILGILGLVCVLFSGHDLLAFNFEAHPGLYTSYEYTDNYRGTVQNEQGDSIYYVGPSLGLTCTSPSTNFDLTGRYTKSFHHRFSEDDSPDIHLITHASIAAPQQETRFSYEFARTLTRESLNEPFGEVRRNTGSIGYTTALTQNTSINAGGNIQTEKWNTTSATAQDLVYSGGNVGITHQLNPLDTISFKAQRDYYFYEISQDVIGTHSTLDIRHVLSPLFSLGLGTVYHHDDRGHDPNDDRYDVNLMGQYAMNQSTMMNVTGGYSWLIMERQDRQTTYITSVSLDKSRREDRFRLSIAKGFTAEFSTNLYGTYDTKTASFSWIRQWLQTWSSSTGLSISKRVPSMGTAGEDETDSNANISLTWKPIEYFTGDLTYVHLQTKYRTSGTARENRYTMTVEVRY
jgi:hypothetical protein